MKFRITLKDPDGVSLSMDETLEEQVKELDLKDDEEIEAIKDVRRDKLNVFISKWVEYGEYVTIEFDSEAGTATVVESP